MNPAQCTNKHNLKIPISEGMKVAQ